MNQENEDTELKTWRTEWQSLGNKEDFASELVARAAKDYRRLRLQVLGKILSAICNIGFCSWAIIHMHGNPQIVTISVFLIMFTTTNFAQWISLSSNLFRAPSEGIEGFIELTRKRLTARETWMTTRLRWQVALTIGIIAWNVWVLATHHPNLSALALFGGVVAVIIYISFRTRTAAKKAHLDMESFERHIANADLA